MSKKENLSRLRTKMHENNIDAYIITMFDPHLSEYVASHWRSIEWFSGFSGSAGTIVVTQNFAGLWTDSRYFIQAEKQLQDTGIELVKLITPHMPEFIGWLYEHLAPGDKVGFDGKTMPFALVDNVASRLNKKEINIMPDLDLIQEIWDDRPPIPTKQIIDHDIKFCGKSRNQKIADVRAEMQRKEIDYLAISSLDDIAWLFNIRGKDISYVPVSISYAMVSTDSATLYIQENKVSTNIRKMLQDEGIQIKDYESIFDDIADINSKSIGIQFSKTNYALFNSISNSCKIIDLINITSVFKSQKNSIEIKNIKETMVKDGVAMVKYLYWLNNSIGKINISEISASKKLRNLREEQEGFFDESFGPISAFNEHAAMPHYSATDESNVDLSAPGIYLIDSGGQYLGGTTDITRTISLGAATERQKNDFTLALKGTIQLSMVVFPMGTKGHQLDYIARKALWDNRLNFGHGTGHGVGFFLNVHEGPQSISTTANTSPEATLMPGMLISNEPAFYREGEYGFRTENLILVVEDETNEFGQFLKFETVTLCPIDQKLINKELLTSEEISWLNNYHKEVYDKLSLYLTDEEKEWLREQTQKII